jgi:hypothetical protein
VSFSPQVRRPNVPFVRVLLAVSAVTALVAIGLFALSRSVQADSPGPRPAANHGGR